jgi:hypothetical protein
MTPSRFTPHLASETTLWAYFQDEQQRARALVYALMSSMDMGFHIAQVSKPFRSLMDWFRNEKGGLMSPAKQRLTGEAAGSLVGRHTRAARQHLPPVLLEGFRPLRQLERLATLIGILQRRIGRLLDDLAEKPALQPFLEPMGEKQAMAAFADFAAETLGIRLTHREMAALAVLGGYEPFTDSQVETERRIQNWQDVRENSTRLLEALRQLAGSPPVRGATDSPEADGGQRQKENEPFVSRGRAQPEIATSPPGEMNGLNH